MHAVNAARYNGNQQSSHNIPASEPSWAEPSSYRADTESRAEAESQNRLTRLRLLGGIIHITGSNRAEFAFPKFKFKSKCVVHIVSNGESNELKR